MFFSSSSSGVTSPPNSCGESTEMSDEKLGKRRKKLRDKEETKFFFGLKGRTRTCYDDGTSNHPKRIF